MLSLTHHILVQYASVRSTREYAILGDDIVLKGLDLSNSYKDIMKVLGVEISISKSVNSFEFIEFAKKVLHLNHVDYSIIGPGLILSVIKNRMLISLLVVQSYYKDFITNIPDALKLLRDLDPQASEFRFGFGLYSLLGLRGFLNKNQKAGEFSRVN